MSADLNTPIEEQVEFARSMAADLTTIADVAEVLLAKYSALDEDLLLPRSGLIELQPTEAALTTAYLLGYQCQVLLRFGIEHLFGVIHTLPSLRPIVPQPSARAAGEAFAGLFELVDPSAEPVERARRALNRRIVSLTEQFNALGEREFIDNIAGVHEVARALRMPDVPDSAEPRRHQAQTIGRRSTSGSLVEQSVASISPKLGSLGRIAYQRTSASVHSQDHGINESSHVEVDGEHHQLPLTNVYPSRFAMTSETFMPAVTAYGALLPFCDRFRLGLSARGRLIEAMQPILTRISTDPAFLGSLAEGESSDS